MDSTITYSIAEMVGMLFAGGCVIVAVGKFLISDWAAKSKENIELRGKLYAANFLKVEKDIDGLGTSFRSFKNEMFKYTKLINKLEFQIDAMTKQLDHCIADIKQIDPTVREIARQEIKISNQKPHIVRD